MMLLLYCVIYWLNLIFAVLIACGIYYLAAVEVKTPRKFLLGLLCMECVIEATILFFYIPWYPGEAQVTDHFIDLGLTPVMARRLTVWLVNYGTTLLFAKLILKPGWLALIVHTILEVRSRIEMGKPHGQQPSLLPQSQERVRANAVAAAKGKIDQAVDTATALDATQELARKVTDSQVLRGKPS